jgi:hypothetical protein
MDWDKVARAYEIVKSGDAKRVDSVGFSVYQAGAIIRIDIKETSQ